MVTTWKVRTTQHTRTLTNGTKYVHAYYTPMWVTEGGVWNVYPDVFSDRSHAARIAKRLSLGQEIA